MTGVITAIVAFLLACLIWPHLVRNKPQYYAAFGCVLLIILIDTITLMFSGARTADGASFAAKLAVFGAVVNGFLTIGALVLCVLFAGGMTVRDLTGEIKGSYEIIRRGESEKEVIIPLRGGGPAARDEGEKSPVYVIDTKTGEDKPT